MIREQRGETNRLSSKKYSTIIQSIESPKRKDVLLVYKIRTKFKIAQQSQNAKHLEEWSST